jgi:transposase
MDEARRVAWEASVEHSGSALSALAERLVREAGGQPEAVAVLLETPQGPVAEGLLERGVHLYSVNPKQLDRLRDRHTVAGAKDDRRDAFVLADTLFADRHLCRRVQPTAADVRQLRELSHLHQELSGELGKLCNQLRELLQRYFPALLGLCAAADEPWLWELLQRAPSPQEAARLRRPALGELLRQHRIRRLSAQALLEALRAPALRLAPGTTEACCTRVKLLLPRLTLLHAQQRDVGRRLDALLEAMAQPSEGQEEGQKREHRDVAILQSLPGVGRIVAAALLAEAWLALTQRDYHALRAHGGAAPVTRQSGKRATVLMRRACCPRLREAFYHWARVSTQHDARCREHYATLRKKGHSHGRALRSVVDRLLRLLMALLKIGTLYDPNYSSRSALTAGAAA